ncbi:MAG TPA: AAA family ATPase [Candidatus Limnocylindrales bacterium]|nr:AAA family ATPase [Candidatus Limnocylindrales bacterium]
MSVLATAPGLVGRASELEAVDRLIRRAHEGAAALVIEGDAGIGKTSIWREGVSRAQAAGIRVLRAAPAESERSLTLGVLTDLLDSVADDELAALPSVQRRTLDVALLREAASGRPPDQRALSVATTALLRSLAAATPLLVAIDDAQWLDPTSAAVLAYALRRLVDLRVAVLLAVRGTAEAGTLELITGAPSDERDRVHVGALPLAGLHQLFRSRLGRSFPRLVLLQIEAASAGNPFYALEIARELAASETELHPGDRLPIPRSLGALVEARIEALAGPTREALLLAATATDPTVEALELVEPATGAALAAAVGAGIVEVQAGAVRFTHPLLAQAVIQTTSPADVRRAHAALARVARSDDARARHLAGASDGPDARVAAALERAAASARDRGATLDAAGLYERASELTPAAQAADALRRAALAGETLFVDVSEVVHADRILARAIEAAAPSPQRAEVMSLHAILRYYHGDTPGAVALGDRAVAEAGTGSGPAARILRATVMARAAFLVMQLDLERGLELVTGALRLLDPAPEATDPELLANVLLLHASAALGLARGYEAAEIERGLALIDPDGRSWEHEGADGIAFGLARMTDDLDRAIEMTRELIQAKSGPGGDDPFNLVQLSGLQVLRGDLEAARASAEAADQGYAAEGADVFPAWRRRGLALVAAHAGQPEDARRLASEGLELALATGDLTLEAYHRHILGFVALAAGDPRGAAEQLEPAAQAARATGTVHPGRFKIDGDRLEAALGAGDVAGARAIATALEEVNAVAPTPWTRAIAARGRGLVLAADGDLAGAVGALEEALRAHADLPMPLERARTLLALGQVHRRRKEKRLADERLRAAIDVFDEVGAGAWVDRARGELARVGRRPHASTDLTETERRVAELAARGLSSREIAEAAFLAPKTVGNVLGRVYAKLEIHSRAELGARMGDRSG